MISGLATFRQTGYFSLICGYFLATFGDKNGDFLIKGPENTGDNNNTLKLKIGIWNSESKIGVLKQWISSVKIVI